MSKLSFLRNFKFTSLRGFEWYRVNAGGSWRRIRTVWLPRCETRPGDDVDAKERHPRKPWSQPYERPGEVVVKAASDTCTA